MTTKLAERIHRAWQDENNTKYAMDLVFQHMLKNISDDKAKPTYDMAHRAWMRSMQTTIDLLDQAGRHVANMRGYKRTPDPALARVVDARVAERETANALAPLNVQLSATKKPKVALLKAHALAEDAWADAKAEFQNALAALNPKT